MTFSLPELGLMRDMIEACMMLDGLCPEEQALYDKIIQCINEDHEEEALAGYMSSVPA